ncbi:pirin family protein [Adhaeretor mobilis]|uniref:Quercetin 2,3-dioxygenase n=1 Tax=Adhaeretor mobilis TaxID=1930276 RepID=A0A517MQD8_9BACT|nr:pirin family protein [Adhaeretor mobilis]QDS96997.1 Quercetin 2,3-dioxygenase [Adhaeretor mobilis]
MKNIKQIVRDIPQHWVGDGFPVRSLFSYSGGNEFDPFLLLDYAGPHEFGPDQTKRGVGEHPHKGFETVTILYQGELEHRDSSGGHGTIGPGDVQWMTAAAGIVHEEFHSRQFAKEGGTLEMVQLWVNLPADAKKTLPKYQDLRDEQFPRVALPDVAGTVRVIAGDFLECRGPAETFTPINVWDVQLNAGRALDARVPAGHTALLIVQNGNLTVNDVPVKAVELVECERAEEAIKLHAETASRVLILTGEPIAEPVYGQGPFVMNTREEIQVAIADYHAGKMGKLSS